MSGSESPLIDEHAAYLARFGIDIDVAVAAGVRSEGRGIVFTWTGPDGRTVEQFRPDDDARGDGPKYLWKAGEEFVLWVHPAMVDKIHGTCPIDIVEGTKQYLAAVSHAPEGRLVVGVTGCQGTRKKGAMAIADMGLVSWHNRDVTIVFDADRTNNRDVFDAAEHLADDVRLRGAGKVRYVDLPGGGTTGLDEVLAEYGPGTYERLVSAASDKPGRPPSKKTRRTETEEGTPTGPGRFFDGDGNLLVRVLAEAAIDEYDLAVNIEGVLCTYRNGVYVPERDPARAVAVEMLEDSFRVSYQLALGKVLLHLLAVRGRVIPEVPTQPWINFANGLYDLDAGEFREHTPEFLSTTQLPVEWDPDAKCPYYLEWAAKQIGDQLEDLEETVAVMLDPTVTPTRAAFLYGQSRSGKGTYLRLVERAAGSANVSAVSLQEMATDVFAGATVFGKIANIAGDLAATEVSDTSLYKKMTGDDIVRANRKYGQTWEFHNRALFLFGANEVPQVSEQSNAFLNRTKPFRFDVTFEGHEDPAVEAALLAELPGIVVRWVRALERWRARGRQYLPTDPAIAAEFAQQSDRVREWAATECTPIESDVMRDWTPGPRLHSAFKAWADQSDHGRLGSGKFYKRLAAAGFTRGKTTDHNTVFALKIGRSPSEGGPSGGSGGPNPPSGRDVDTQGKRDQEPAEMVEVVGPPYNAVDRGNVNGESDSLSEPVKGVIGEAHHSHHLPLTFDIETASADQLFTRGPEFIRIIGTSDGEVGPDVALPSDRQLVAHNGFRFDFVALARYRDLDLLTLGEADQIIDTRVLARLADPPPDRKVKDPRNVSGYYGLDATAERFGVEGKSGDLRALALESSPTKKWEDGLDKIPVDDQRYLDYCAADVGACERVLAKLELNDYARREMRLHTRLVSGITVTGFRVDTDLLAERLDGVRSRKAAGRARLINEYGLPELKADGKPARDLLSTKGGKERLEELFGGWGVPLDQMERTDKGTISFGGKPMRALADLARQCDDPHADDIAELADLVADLVAERTVYDTLDKYTVDGRVHPMIDAGQASGRFSVTAPGLTVLGKRKGKHAEREVLVADEGCVIRAFDMSQIDARAVAALSQCPDYMERFAPGRDLHQEVADALGLEDREAAKPFSHGFPYGMGVGGMVKQGLDADLSSQYIEYMHDTFPRLCAWMEEMRREAATLELIDNGFGRMMRPDPYRDYTQGPALMGQGCARDLMAEAVLRLPIEIVPMIRMWAHDEIVMSIPEDQVDEVSAAVLDAMSFEWRGVQILGDASRVGPSWGSVYAK